MEKRWWVLIVISIIILITLLIFFYPKKWDYSNNCFGSILKPIFNEKNPWFIHYDCYGIVYGKKIDKSLIDSEEEAINYAKNDKEVINLIQSGNYYYGSYYNDGEWSVTYCGEFSGDKCLSLDFTPYGNITDRKIFDAISGLDRKKRPISNDNFKESLDTCKFEYMFREKNYNGTYCNVSLYDNGLKWISDNTSRDSIVFTMWEESSLIRAFSDRDAVVVNPSQYYYSDILDSIISDEDNYKEGYNKKDSIIMSMKSLGYFDNGDKFKDVAYAFSTTNITKTKEIIRKYNSSYIFLTNNNYLTGKIIVQHTGHLETKNDHCYLNYSRDYRIEVKEIGKDDCIISYNITKYNNQYCLNTNIDTNEDKKCYASYNKPYCENLIVSLGKYEDICLNQNTFIYKILKLENIEGFEKVYSDNYTVIYKLVN